MYDEHRNLLQVVAHLADAAKHLNPSHPTHRALFIDCAWLYTLSLAHAARYVRAVHVSDIDTALQQYLFGGQLALQEKRKLAAALAHYAPSGAAADGNGVLPTWYSQLLELLTRHLRRPTVLGDELRYAEWIGEAQLSKETSTAAEAFSPSFNPFAAKLLADVCGFLVTVSRVDPEFRTSSRRVCAQADSAPSQPSPSQASGESSTAESGQ